MLVRGLTTIEGVIAQIAPDINVVQVATARMSGNRFSASNMKEELHILSLIHIWIRSAEF